MKRAHGAVSGFVEELAVTGQGELKAPYGAHPTPSQTVVDAQAGEAGRFEKIADGAEKAQLDFAWAAPRRQGGPVQTAVEHYGIELAPRQREVEQLRADHLDGRPHFSGADVDKTSPLESAFDSRHAGKVAAEGGCNGPPVVSRAEDGGIPREIPDVLKIRAAGVADQARIPGDNPLDGRPPPDLPRQAIGPPNLVEGCLLRGHFSSIPK
jgi:hypothetical protein